jgi:hypothetical protein
MARRVKGHTYGWVAEAGADDTCSARQDFHRQDHSCIYLPSVARCFVTFVTGPGCDCAEHDRPLSGTHPSAGHRDCTATGGDGNGREDATGHTRTLPLALSLFACPPLPPGQRSLEDVMVQCSRGARTNNGPCDLQGRALQRGAQHNHCRLVLHTRTPHTHTRVQLPPVNHRRAVTLRQTWAPTLGWTPLLHHLEVRTASTLLTCVLLLLVEVTDPPTPPHMHPLPFPSPGRSDGAVGCERTTHPRCA